jgi:hypothetical protein
MAFSRGQGMNGIGLMDIQETQKAGTREKEADKTGI